MSLFGTYCHHCNFLTASSEPLGLDRFATVAAAKAALQFFRGDLRQQFAGRLLRLAHPNIYVSGFDVQMFLILLPAFFPAGLLLLLEKGVLVYLSSASAPRSVLPEAVSARKTFALSFTVLVGINQMSIALLHAPCLFWVGHPSFPFAFFCASGHSDARLRASLALLH